MLCKFGLRLLIKKRARRMMRSFYRFPLRIHEHIRGFLHANRTTLGLASLYLHHFCTVQYYWCHWYPNQIITLRRRLSNCQRNHLLVVRSDVVDHYAQESMFHQSQAWMQSFTVGWVTCKQLHQPLQHKIHPQLRNITIRCFTFSLCFNFCVVEL